jgi:diguanylate cyclase (GGDEF)-like protein
MSSKPTFEENLKRLKEQYASQLPEKINNIQDDWLQIKNTWEQETITRLHRNVHSLIGTSGTFGFSALSTQARELETALKPFTQASPQSTDLPDIYRLIEQKLKKLLGLVEQIEGDNSLTPNREKKETTTANNDHFIDVTQSKDVSNLLDQTLIYYLDDDLASSAALAENLNSYGFTAEHFREPLSMLERIRERPPALVILDLIIPDFSESWIFNLSRQLNEKQIKTFILSGKNDFDCRLSAVRSGASSYIVKPANIPALVNNIRAELNINAFKPPHVLLVDDQDSILEYYSTVLAAAGMKVDISNNPLDVLDRMEKQRPDLIVLDINMPIVKGDELAAVIRQFPEYQSIPILFFSQDTVSLQKTDLLEIGSDDLLHKGMPIAELVRQIKSRVDRAKILSSFMYEDSLTGLLNHAQIQLAAEKNYALAKRHQRFCSIAMLDLDNFKTVNDTWGHQTGDKVIKAFSQLLQQRLRASDIIGRYGGEEFMLVLPETKVNDAGAVINEIRKMFQNIEFYAGTEKFQLSFSAGIAEASQSNSVSEQIRKADEALYRAKSSGKNKVCMSLQ